MKRPLGFVLAFLAFVVLVSSGLDAAKPPKNPPPPPPPPPNPVEIYEWRPDLGGVLDTRTNLVWGYSFWDLKGTSTHSGYGITQQMAMTTVAANYADYLYEMAEVDLPAAAAETEAWADEQVARGDAALAAGDVDLANRYYERAELNYAKAQDDLDSIPLYIEAGDVADQFIWRLPTQAEAQTAIANGLFTYGDGGFNGYDASPRIGFGGISDVLTWTSTKVKKNGWAFWPLGGAGGEVGVNSQINAIFVRTYVP